MYFFRFHMSTLYQYKESTTFIKRLQTPPPINSWEQSLPCKRDLPVAFSYGGLLVPGFSNLGVNSLKIGHR